MKELQQGGNAPLATPQTSATLRWSLAHVHGQELDVSAFLLAANGKVRNDADFVFYGAMASPCGSLRLTRGRDEAKFDIRTDRIPAEIDKVAFVATLPKGIRFGSVQSLVFSVEAAGTYPVVTAGMSEAAIIVAELYKRNGQWKMRAVGQGFNGGLGPLATQYGVNVDDSAPVPIASPTPAPSRLQLNKITLEKTGQSATLSLEKSSGEIAVNLNWSQGRSGVDLDLGCYWRLRNGSHSLIDGLQFSRGRGGPRDKVTKQGCFVGQPWVWHQGDDRTGSAHSGETILVNPQGIKELHRLVIYAFIFEGAAAWGSTDAVITIKAPGHEVSINMGQQSDRRTFCALAELTFSGSNEVSIKKLMTFHEGHQDCDKAYGWGFRYGVGGK